jgi:phenylacetic acid degradation operon negative regulatory protein
MGGVSPAGIGREGVPRLRSDVVSTGPGIVVTATRRRADGGPSARALLISVIGQWVPPENEPVWNAALVGALEALGIEERAARQAINRTASDGWLEGESVGRYTRWRVTPVGRRLLDTARNRLSRSLFRDPWDGRFLLLLLTGAGPDRATRERLATRLDFEGFGILGPNLWISADRRAQAGAESLLEEFELPGPALLFDSTTVEGAETPAEVVAMAWDLDSARAAHEAFLAAFDGVVPADDREAFALTTRLSHEWRHLLSIDPALPPELLPADWPGWKATDLFHRCRSEWDAAATAFYAQLAEESAAS